MSKRALFVAVLSAVAWIGCDNPPLEVDGGPTGTDSGPTGMDAGPGDDDDAGPMTGDDAGPGEDAGPDEEDAGPDEEDGGPGDVCGDGMVSGSETCDSAIAAGMPGACPTSCDDGIGCTTDMLTGAASTCDAACTTTMITACMPGDACCPTTCTMDSDADCECVAETTCPAGACGTIDDGCGGILDCGTCGIGGPCTTDTDCATGNVCITQADSGWTDGYCSVGCFDDTHCATGSHCVGGDAVTATTGFCAADCTTDADCRSAGYACVDSDGNGSTGCAPSATGTGVVGAACTSHGDCAGGLAGGCILESQGWQGGYCTVSCTSDADCGAGAHCGVANPDTGVGSCWADCTAGGSSCRAAGYACYDGDGDAVTECAPAATGTGTVGAACTQTFECAGDLRGFCFSEEEAGLHGGYCTLGCLPDGGTGPTGCPTGSHCGLVSADTGQGVCVADCTAGSCRSDGDGYLCYDVDADTTDECWEAATGTGAVGAPCAGSWDCAGGQTGACVRDTDPDMPGDEFPGGYCIQLCGTGGTCPSGSTCYMDVCYDACASSAECRAPEYGCGMFPDTTITVCGPTS